MTDTANRSKKKICRECPFKRSSLPGYLGAGSYQPREFLAPHWHGDLPLPCHMTVDWTDKDAQEMALTKPLCRGMLVMAKNACKLLDNPDSENARRVLEADRENVFGLEHEFYAHHAPAKKHNPDGL